MTTVRVWSFADREPHKFIMFPYDGELMPTEIIAAELVHHAVKRFRFSGAFFFISFADKVYYSAKIKNEWKAYELKLDAEVISTDDESSTT